MTAWNGMQARNHAWLLANAIKKLFMFLREWRQSHLTKVLWLHEKILVLTWSYLSQPNLNIMKSTNHVTTRLFTKVESRSRTCSRCQMKTYSSQRSKSKPTLRVCMKFFKARHQCCSRTANSKTTSKQSQKTAFWWCQWSRSMAKSLIQRTNNESMSSREKYSKLAMSSDPQFLNLPIFQSIANEQ